jgi:hypothetical protein
MSQDPSPGFPVRWQALRPWIVTLGAIWILGSVGLGTLVQDACPVCQYTFSALNNSQANCPNCGEALSVANQRFQRPSSPGTIDVQAVEVTAQVVEDDD